MHKNVFAGVLLAGIMAAVPAVAQNPAPSKATTPAPATTTAAPGATTTGPGAAESSRRRGGAEAAATEETRAMSLLTFEERKEHRAKMVSFNTVAECKSYVDAFWQNIEKRAKEKGVAGPFSGPRPETCDQMKARGQIK